MATFANPVLSGLHADPSVCRVGRDFYLVTSSFEYFPGVPIFHSRDLVNWRLIGHVLTRKSQLDLTGVRSSGGIYAPTIRYAAGRFHVVTTHVDGGGNFLVTANKASGPWSDPVWIDSDGIDPSLLFADGTVYYTRNGPGADRDHPLIYQTTIDPRTGKLGGTPRVIWSGLGGIWPESPHLYKIGRWYYLLTAEGGTGYDHSIVIARSRSPHGPFEGCPDNPILTHRYRPRDPIGATGHADLVQLTDGSWWAVMLGVRPNIDRGTDAGTPGGIMRHHHLGRETFLAPVTWRKRGGTGDHPRGGDTWPSVGEAGRVKLRMRAPALAAAQAPAREWRDDFERRELAPLWNFVRNPRQGDWSLSDRPGFLRLVGSAIRPGDRDSPALVARRQQHFAVRCRALLDFSPRLETEEAGLLVRASDDFHDQLTVTGDGSGAAGSRQLVLRERLRGVTREVGRLPLTTEGPVVLQVAATRRWYTFSAAVLSGRLRMRRLGRLPTAGLSYESVWAAGQEFFAGAFLGLFATGNGRRSASPADFDWFQYLPAQVGWGNGSGDGGGDREGDGGGPGGRAGRRGRRGVVRGRSTAR